LIDYLRWTRWDGRLPQFQGGSQPLISVPLDQTQSQAQQAPQPTAQATQPQTAQPQPTAQAGQPTPTPAR
jgi:hypothetical protein